MTNEELLRQVNFDKPDFSARSSEVFDLGEGKVLKLYFTETEDASIDREILNTKVAFETGCTPMACYGDVKIRGRRGLILKKLEGCSMTNMPGKNPLILFTAGKILATLHANVHSKKAPQLKDVRQETIEVLEREAVFNFLTKEDKERLKAYILALPEGDNILHMDFHTDNILCDGNNYQVIDWMTALRGNPLAEVAMMNFLHHEAELFPGSSRLKIAFMQMVRGGIYNSFIKITRR
ncbi:MAG: aminoglycoside phosphotransferase family protein [Frisingicoccus sp.]